MTSLDEHQWTDSVEAAESLRTALTAVGIVLPSLAPDDASPELRLVVLGRVRADVAVELADVIRRGGVNGGPAPAETAHARSG